MGREKNRDFALPYTDTAAYMIFKVGWTTLRCHADGRDVGTGILSF
jgi:hypothetical protein